MSSWKYGCANSSLAIERISTFLNFVPASLGSTQLLSSDVYAVVEQPATDSAARATASTRNTEESGHLEGIPGGVGGERTLQPRRGPGNRKEPCRIVAPPAIVMDLASLIQNWGYPAVFAGSLIEGETILALAAVAAHRGDPALPWVIALAVVGGFLGDQIYFLVGRFGGERVLAHWPTLRPGAERVRQLLERYDAPLILGVRFLYGLRTVGPIAIGMSRVQWSRFAVLNLVGAIVWAGLVAGIGYALGEALTRVLGDLKRVEEWVFGAILVGGLALVAWLRHRGRRAAAAVDRP